MLVRLILSLTLALPTLLLATHSAAAEPGWFPVNMQLGCVPLQDLYDNYPDFKGVKSPSGVVAILQKNGSEVKAQPFADMYDSEEYRTAHPNGAASETPQEQAIRKLFTKSNAIMVTWKRGSVEDGLLFYTEALCKTVYRKTPS
ncbi:hypothetical protein [Massilia sp. CF038]|uniref:hypothetical protein n=1 Tax=Massilia sp. CF038 TaxID=1881045 RepID=UPI00091AB441|nr:hypothetical protein [Massilia sp. CF038]SHG96915.1 hypothetical protein SAMN05428948_2108 [Massilia sp. CF038]